MVLVACFCGGGFSFARASTAQALLKRASTRRDDDQEHLHWSRYVRIYIDFRYR